MVRLDNMTFSQLNLLGMHSVTGTVLCRHSKLRWLEWWYKSSLMVNKLFNIWKRHCTLYTVRSKNEATDRLLCVTREWQIYLSAFCCQKRWSTEEIERVHNTYVRIYIFQKNSNSFFKKRGKHKYYLIRTYTLFVKQHRRIRIWYLVLITFIESAYVTD